MTQSRFTAFDFALYAAVVFSWGFSWIAMHYQVGVVVPEISVIWRFALAAPLMLAIAAWRGERLRYSLSDHAAFFALGLALFCVNFALFYHGSLYLPSGLVAVVFSLAAVVNIPFSALFLGVPFDARVLAGGALGFSGIAAMFYPQIASTELHADAVLGLGLCALGVLSFCSGSMISARLQRRGIPIFAGCGFGMVYGALALAGFSAFRGYPFTIEWTAPYLGGLIFLSLISSVVAFGAYLTLLGRIGAERAGYSTVMFPVVALVVSTFAEDYRWTWPAIAGLIAVLAGNLLVLRGGKRA